MIGRHILLLLLCMGGCHALYGQQLRLLSVQDTAFPTIDAEIELRDLAAEPVREDFVVKSGDRPYPFELQVLARPASATVSRQVLILIEASPAAAGEDLLSLKKALKTTLERVPGHTAIGMAYFTAQRDTGFSILQEPTADAERYTTALNRLYSNPDTNRAYTLLTRVDQAARWLGTHKQELRSELLVLSVASGRAAGDPDLSALRAYALDADIPIHSIVLRGQQAQVADQLKELSAGTQGKYRTTRSLSGLTAALENVLGSTDSQPQRGDYRLRIRFSSDEREDGETHQALVLYREEHACTVPYLAASASYRARANGGLLQRYSLYLILAGGGGILLLLVSAYVRRHRRSRLQALQEQQWHQQASQKIGTVQQQPSGQVAQPLPPGTSPAPQQLQAEIAGEHLCFVLAGYTLTLGRTPENDITLPHATVSARHALLRQQGGSWWIEDLGSTNGLMLNGMQVERASLKPGDTISVGKVTLRVK